VVAAGLDVLAASGWDGLTIADLAERAGVSVGLVYKRFGDKDDVVLALHEAFLERVAADWRARPVPDPDAPLGVFVRASIGSVTALLRRHQDVLRQFMTRSVRDARIADPASEFTRSMSRQFKAELLERREEFKHPSPEVAVDVCFRIFYDVAARRIILGPRFEADLIFEWDRLVDELAQACTAYLTTRPEPLSR
jgi:AcrR family transcriptional regulator